ncbi:hypothetical protein PoB_000440500 [Plakobranchus ocellatus]|uniref:Uncharacterized protein n=1 Tax=Plakobranchus ocellatus TaxID=259542 RepID=A0AAV3Y4A8_9GAST|nr:hypothetical protein PoB_000440500 [Plakobranchus ocellatus]
MGSKDTLKSPSRKNIHTDYHSVTPLSSLASESALRSAGTLLSRVRAPPLAPWPDGGHQSHGSPSCGLAIYQKPSKDEQFKTPYP